MFHKILCIHGPCGSPVPRTLVLFFLVIPPLPLSLKCGLYHGLPDYYTLSSSDSFFFSGLQISKVLSLLHVFHVYMSTQSEDARSVSSYREAGCVIHYILNKVVHMSFY